MTLFKTCTLAVVLLVIVFGLQQPSQFEISYDVQKDLTTVRLPFSRISGEKDRYYSLHYSVFFTYTGKTKQVPESVSLELISVVKARQLNPDLYVVFIVDGEQLHFGSNRSAIKNPVKGRTWIGERMVFSIPLEKFEKLAAAKTLTVKLGAVQFSLSDQDRESLQAFAKECRG